MSCEQNTILEENAWERFLEMYDTNECFKELIDSKFTHKELWIEKEHGRSDEDALPRIFDEIYDKESDCFIILS